MNPERRLTPAFFATGADTGSSLFHSSQRPKAWFCINKVDG
jgi:hypothetical protein